MTEPAIEPACETCAWRYRGGPGKLVLRCRAHGGARLEKVRAGCARYEPPLDCQACGACCREAYHSVTISSRDPVVRRHPELVVRGDGYLELRREAGRCAALAGPPSGPYACRIYDERPVRPCREFDAGGPHCLTARRRVGLSQG